MSSDTDPWAKVFSDKAAPSEVSEQLKALKYREDRSRRRAWALVFIFLGAVLIVAGAYVLGSWSDSLWPDLIGDRLDLELGIVLSLSGTVVLTVAIDRLLHELGR